MEEESAPPFRMEQRGRVGIANRGMKGDGAVVVDTAPWVGFVARPAATSLDDETTRVNVAINGRSPFPDSAETVRRP